MSGALHGALPRRYICGIERVNGGGTASGELALQSGGAACVVDTDEGDDGQPLQQLQLGAADVEAGDDTGRPSDGVELAGGGFDKPILIWSLGQEVVLLCCERGAEGAEASALAAAGACSETANGIAQRGDEVLVVVYGGMYQHNVRSCGALAGAAEGGYGQIAYGLLPVATGGDVNGSSTCGAAAQCSGGACGCQVLSRGMSQAGDDTVYLGGNHELAGNFVVQAGEELQLRVADAHLIENSGKAVTQQGGVGGRLVNDAVAHDPCSGDTGYGFSQRVDAAGGYHDHAERLGGGAIQ